LIALLTCFEALPNTNDRTKAMCIWKENIKKKFYDPVQGKRRWRNKWNSEIYNLYKDLNIMDDIKIKRLGWAGYIIRGVIDK